MKSKNLFWARCIENLKRRVWVILLVLLTQLLLPAELIIYYSRIYSYAASGAYKTPQLFHQAMLEATWDSIVRPDGFMGLVVVFMAMLIGIQSFSYLFHKEKVDLYHSVPVSRKERFVMIVMNGTLIYLVSSFFALLIALLAATTQKAITGQIIGLALLMFAFRFLFFLGVFFMVVLAVMITGTLGSGIAVSVVFLAYEMTWRGIFQTLAGYFFRAVNYSFDLPSTAFTPYSLYARVETVMRGSRESADLLPALGYAAGWLLVNILVFGCLSFLAYRKRPSEAAGRTLAFDRLRPVIKVLVSVPVAFMVSLFVYQIAEINYAVLAVAICVVAVFAAVMMEILYERDLRAIGRGIGYSLLAVLISGMIFAVFRFDLIGYDRFVPKESDLESFALLGDGDAYGSDTVFRKENMYYYGPQGYAKEHMFIKEKDAVIQLAKLSAEREQTEWYDYHTISVLYRMKNGKLVSKYLSLDLNDPKTQSLIAQILGTEEYRIGVFQALTEAEELEDLVRGVAYYDYIGVQKIPAIDYEALIAAWKSDMAGYDFDLIAHNKPIGELRVNFQNYSTWFLPVFEGFDHTRAALEQRDVVVGKKETLTAKDIASISVLHYHYNDAAVLEDDYDYYEGPTTVIYEDKESVEKLLALGEFFAGNSSWYLGGETETDYELYVTLKDDGCYDEPVGTIYAYFPVGSVPNFVIADTAVQ